MSKRVKNSKGALSKKKFKFNAQYLREQKARRFNLEQKERKA